MTELADKSCIPSDGNTPPVRDERARQLLGELGDGWSINDSGHLEKLFVFKNFVEAIGFANAVGDIAEAEGHHPDLHIGWGRCGIEIWTHDINGLAESDFFLAAKVDRAHNQRVQASE
jgi:4a-hydroxytetrahydrobiopterin dehydratase